MILYIFFKISAHNYKELRATPLTVGSPWFYLKVEMNSISNLKSLNDFIVLIKFSNINSYKYRKNQ